MDGVISGPLLGTRPYESKRRNKGSVRKSVGTLAFTLFAIVILIIIYLLFVSSRLWVVNLGYRISETLKEQRELVEANKKLRIEQATLISPDQIDLDARQKLGMREPQQNQVRFVP